MLQYDAILQSDSQKIKNFRDFWYYFNKCSCDVGVSVLPDIMQKPSCDGGISDLYDINGYYYHELSGKHICELMSASMLQKNELMLLTRYMPSSQLCSMKMEYDVLSGQLFEDVLCGLGLHTMAFEPSYRYAVSSHCHDTLYSRVSYYGHYESGPEVSTVGMICLSTDYLTGSGSRYDDIDSNPSKKAVNAVTCYVNVPKVVIPLPPKPMIGTLKIVSAKSAAKLKAAAQLNVAGNQVDPYDANGKVRKEYSGWVFANGVLVENKDNQLSAASLVYNGDSSSNILPPVFSSFFKLNPYTKTADSIAYTPYDTTIPPHQHVFNQCKLDGKLDLVSAFIPFSGGNKYVDIAANDPELLKLSTAFKTRTCSWATNNPENHQDLAVELKVSDVKIPIIKVKQCQASGEETWPTHNLVPVMVYIGGETREYYEYIYQQYHAKQS